jgi:hypothetical protein
MQLPWGEYLLFNKSLKRVKMKTFTHGLIVCMVVFSFLLGSGDAHVKAVALTTSQWVTPLELDFGPVGVGATSPQMMATITNSGNAPLTGWAGGAVNSPFSASQDCNISGGVLPGNSCHYYFTFSPTAPGTFSATSTSSTNAGSIQIILHGTGVGASLTYDAHALDFGDLFTGKGVPAVAPTQVVTIRNTGMAPLTNWAGGGVPAPFSASQDCNITGGVLPGHSCHYYFGFSTSSIGTFSATSTSSTNGGTITVDLSGKTHSLIFVGGGQQVSPLSLDFGPVGIGSTAQISTTLTNHGLTNITGWAGGGVPAPFNGSQDCNIAGGLPPGESCHFYYSFQPTSAGSFSSVSNVSDSFGSFSIALQGTGAAPSMFADALWLDFGPLSIGHIQGQIVTITNTGLTPLAAWAGGAVPPPFNGSQNCNIAGGVLPGNSCQFFYTFSPASVGLFSATSTFSTNAGTITIKMQGQGLPATILPANFLPAILK